MKLAQWRDRLLPQSIVARMSLVLFVGILIAQVMGALLWANQVQNSERERLVEITQNLGARAGQTLQFFGRLPREYRHIVLDQLRDMGGTRFFVSVNTQYIELPQLAPTGNFQIADQNLRNSLQAQTGPIDSLNIQFVAFDQLKVLSGQNRMVDLPMQWQRFALLDPGDRSPVAVIQHPLNEQEWVYVAAVLPVGDSFFGVSWLTPDRLISLGLVSLTVLVLTIILVRWIVRPLRLLAIQADALGRGITPERLLEQGSREMKTTIKAFNAMGQRLHKFIADRERLFASISHDLKTPLTRARLRAEMVDDTRRDDLITDLDNLDVMLKGVLQMLKEGAIHENAESIDLTQLLRDSVKNASITDFPCSLNVTEDLRLTGRRLALERVFSNLIDNALHYAHGVEIQTSHHPDKIIVDVLDRGPGIPDALKTKVFEPYYRRNLEPNPIHVGLGLGIVRSLVQQQGGDIELLDRAGGGLIVRVTLPLSHFATTGHVASHPTD